MAVKTRSATKGSRLAREERGECGARALRSSRKSDSPKRDKRRDCSPQRTRTVCPAASGKWVTSIRCHLGLSDTALTRLSTTFLDFNLILIYIRYHISSLFENDRHFSHLSTLEREMAFRTEMGLYYSFFKIIIEAPSFTEGLRKIMNDRLTEYPLVINTLKRFNLYPEVVLASWYRSFISITDAFGISIKMCWSVNRGHGLNPVESCEGMGDPAYFYVTFVFILNGLMMSLFFLYGTYLSGSRLGGVVTASCFFFNHGECTRVMWTPPLRESFSYPFLILQMLLLTHILRTPFVDKRTMVAFGVANILFMLPWQFAQFVLLTQIASLFATYILGFIDSSKLLEILYAHMISLLLCFALMFGNAMLLSSYYASSLVIVWGMIRMKDWSAKYWPQRIHVACVAKGTVWLIGTVILKFVASKILGIDDDAHISNLLKSKFTNYKDFDTLMYSCAVEFDFMEKETPLRYTKTLLLPVTLCIFCAIVSKTLKELLEYLKEEHQNQPTDTVKKTAQHGEVVYHAFQLLAFAVLAILIMRLKLFLTPHMCVMASLICSRQLFGWITTKWRHQIIVCGILAAMAIQGTINLRAQWSIMGEFSNFPQEELLEWIKENTKQNAVFAGAMPTMASVKLSTGRPVVNHPHYEDAGLRARTKQVYAMYSRKTAEDVRNRLVSLGVNYFILEDSWCTRKTKPGCSMPEIWDVEDPQNANRIPLCTILSKAPGPFFITMFQNDIYTVLKVKKNLRWQ
uniref:Dpy-19-like 1, like (H. sapiens) n=1 Tax=Callorhinchus milii TaxID=7868 RepID=A0A4W3JVR9_CALMI